MQTVLTCIATLCTSGAIVSFSFRQGITAAHLAAQSMIRPLAGWARYRSAAGDRTFGQRTGAALRLPLGEEQARYANLPSVPGWTSQPGLAPTATCCLRKRCIP